MADGHAHTGNQESRLTAYQNFVDRLPLRAAATASTLLTFAAGLGFLLYEASRTKESNPPDLSFVPAIVVAMLGAVVNPGKTIGKLMWVAVAVFALLGMVWSGYLALTRSADHPDALPALEACLAAFAGLVVDTDQWAQSGKTDLSRTPHAG